MLVWISGFEVDETLAIVSMTDSEVETEVDEGGVTEVGEFVGVVGLVTDFGVVVLEGEVGAVGLVTGTEVVESVVGETNVLELGTGSVEGSNISVLLLGVLSVLLVVEILITSYELVLPFLSCSTARRKEK